MKNKLLFLLLGIAVILCVLFTKRTVILSLHSGCHYTYGFPLTGFVVQEGEVAYIYIANIVFNILLFFPAVTATVLSFIQKQYRKFNDAMIIIFSAVTVFSLFLPWQFRQYSFLVMLILYSLWILWMIFLICNILIKKKHDVKS